ncbi:MAG: hypothetical protein H6Q86_3232 [candidate division NC10 bacterium]|nr:hypothetical protein [candidate division NC10 bacterium]
MKTRRLAVALAVGGAVLVLVGGPARADNVSIGVSTPSVSFGLNIGSPPPLVAVPGLPVRHAPAVPHNYFVYGGYYYLFNEGTWFYSPYYNGPWSSLVIHQVPRPILAVPVTYYKRVPPGHLKKGGPPEWAGYGHGKDKGKHKHKDKHKGRDH